MSDKSSAKKRIYSNGSSNSLGSLFRLSIVAVDHIFSNETHTGTHIRPTMKPYIRVSAISIYKAIKSH